MTPTRLRAVEVGEKILREATGIEVVRCRLRDTTVVVEVRERDRVRVSEAVLDSVVAAMRAVEPAIAGIRLDDRPYRPGRAVLGVS